MGKYTAYEIYDRRTQEQIDERVLDDAIQKYISSDAAFIATLDDFQKIDFLKENGFIVRPMQFITTGKHQSGYVPGTDVDPFKDHIQVDFNYPDKSIVFDLHMEEYDGKRYLFVEFFPSDKVLNLMFDEDGNEKIYEACPHCGDEVVLDAIEKIKQPCPKCGSMIKACCLCNGDEDCKNCG